ncbi:hypothetical protein BH09ACT10_BH09ACT10_01340 [soil metagenome]
MFADVGRLDAGRIGAAFDLDHDQQALIPALVEQVRLFFDGTVSIGGRGLDAPIRGDLSYHTWFDYEIDVPAWARYRAD